MIRSLTIENFQSHKRSFLELHPGMNVIIGPSDSGKTAIFRALRWLVWNRPLGDSFRSVWASSTSVSVENGDRSIITRSKSKEQNGYRLNNNVFVALGNDIPEEISNRLNITDINLQQQMDAPFLLSNSAGEVAQHFNKVARLDQIDSSLLYIQRSINDLTKDISYKEKELEKLEKAISIFSNLDKYEIDVEVLESMAVKVTASKTNEKILSKLINKVEEVEKEVQENSQILVLDQLLNNVADLITEKKEIQRQQLKLQDLYDSLFSTEQKIKKKKKLLTLASGIDEIFKLITLKNEKDIESEKLIKLGIAIKKINKEIETGTQLYNQLHETFEKEFPDICPLCNK